MKLPFKHSFQCSLFNLLKPFLFKSLSYCTQDLFEQYTFSVFVSLAYPSCRLFNTLFAWTWVSQILHSKIVLHFGQFSLSIPLIKSLSFLSHFETEYVLHCFSYYDSAAIDLFFNCYSLSKDSEFGLVLFPAQQFPMIEKYFQRKFLFIF